MQGNRTKILVLLAAYGGLVGVALFGMDWFVINSSFGKIGLDLRAVHACDASGQCGSVSMSMIRGIGFYPMLAGATFWGTLGLSALLLYQVATRLLAGSTRESLIRISYGLAVLLLGTTVGAAYLFGPEIGSVSTATMSLSSERTFAPLMLIAGQLVAIGMLYFIADDDDLGQGVPNAQALPARQWDRSPAAPADAPPTGGGRGTRSTAPPPVSPSGRAMRGTVPPPQVPSALRNQLRFVTASAELTQAGIDARQEDGSAVLVLWRDVVGAVARRLPPELDGATFVDVISTPGATLRILPWTRLSGDLVDGEGSARARELLAMVTSRHPEAKLDPSTRRFVHAAEPAMQLPDRATLDEHDARLA
ncbi:MAG: hypothetical protein IPQ07_40975 [Myxococcales bacterium]|nr:hypothetical protein [Myxococcales bacterium]